MKRTERKRLRTIAAKQAELAAQSSCRANEGERCSCANGIGCIHVPYERW